MAHQTEKQRCGGFASGKGRIGRAVKIADPDHQHIVTEQPGGPGVFISVRGSGFPINLIGRAGTFGKRQAATVNRRIVRKHIQCQKCGFGRKHCRFRQLRFIFPPAQRPKFSSVAEHGIKCRQILRRNLRAAQRQSQPIVAGRFQLFDAGFFQHLVKTVFFQTEQQIHRRNITAVNQRLRGIDQTVK